MPTVKEFFRGKSKLNCTIFGAGPCGVSHGDIVFLEELFRAHQEWQNIVELGTGGGLTTLWLAHVALLRGGKVRTFDCNKSRPYYSRFWPTNVDFYFQDCRNDISMSLINSWMKIPNTVLIIDDGNKRKSFHTYYNNIAVNNGLIVHDYPSEINDDDFSVLNNGWSKVLETFAQSCLSKYRAWARI